MTTVNTLFSGGQGTAVPSGLVLNTQSSSALSISNTASSWFSSGLAFTLNPGTYLIYIYATAPVLAGVTGMAVNIASNGNNDSTGFLISNLQATSNGTSTNCVISATPIIALTSTTSIYLKSFVYGATGGTSTGNLTSIRIG
jgi:hypothetical protein